MSRVCRVPVVLLDALVSFLIMTLKGAPSCTLQAVMKDPVLAADGNSYENKAITEWLRSGKATSPVTGEPFSSDRLLPNYTLRSMISSMVDAGLL